MSLAVAAPVTHFLVKRDSLRHRKRSFGSRFYLHLALLVATVLLSKPFLSRPANYFDRFNTIISADPSTVYQQYMRAQKWLDSQITSGAMPEAEATKIKQENDKIHSRIHSSKNKLLYNRFGDLIDYDQGIDEPSFLMVAGFAAVYVAWFFSACVLTCHALPSGGFLAILLMLLTIFCVEIEARFVSTDLLFSSLLFINESDWAVFEAIRACKQAMVGLVCVVLIIAGMFHGEADNTKTLLRNALRTNAGIVTVLKDDNIKELNIDPDEPLERPGVNLASTLARWVGLFFLVSSIFLRSA